MSEGLLVNTCSIMSWTAIGCVVAVIGSRFMTLCDRLSFSNLQVAYTYDTLVLHCKTLVVNDLV